MLTWKVEWKVESKDRARKKLRSLDAEAQKRILGYMRESEQQKTQEILASSLLETRLVCGDTALVTFVLFVICKIINSLFWLLQLDIEKKYMTKEREIREV